MPPDRIADSEVSTLVSGIMTQEPTWGHELDSVTANQRRYGLPFWESNIMLPGGKRLRVIMTSVMGWGCMTRTNPQAEAKYLYIADTIIKRDLLLLRVADTGRDILDNPTVMAASPTSRKLFATTDLSNGLLLSGSSALRYGISMSPADCPVVLLAYSKDKLTVLLELHCGYKEMAAGLIEAAIGMMRHHGALVQDIVGIVTPSARSLPISHSNYLRFSESTRLSSRCFHPNVSDEDNPVIVDCTGLAVEKLVTYGVTKVAGSSIDTYSSSCEGLFYSHRRDPSSGNRCSVVAALEL